MASGLAALLDDIAAIAKLAAASIDDVGLAAGKAGAKAAGVVVDDTAVTPRYVVGFTPERELPIIARIARGSLVNKLLYILPAALLLSALAPWAITPILMIGGAYLCFEGAEKVLEALTERAHTLAEDVAELSSAEHEKTMVAGAIRTDFILSAEIMAIALAEVATEPLLSRGTILAVVAVAITAAVYGAVALIVKMDDVGLHLAGRQNGPTRALGRALVKGMPLLLQLLSVVGIAAMIWVGGGIVLHGMEEFGFVALAHAIDGIAEAVAHSAPSAAGALLWTTKAAGAGLFGLVLGGIIVAIHHRVAAH